jgi:hypothetical protein
METHETILNIEKHLHLYDLVINHGYLPNGSAAAVLELDAISVAYGHRKTDLYCPHCIKELFKRVFETYLPRIKDTVELQDELFIADMAEPKKKRPRITKTKKDATDSN